MTKIQVEQSRHPGSCHCGAVRFEAEVDASAGSRCNCSVCTKIGATTAIVRPEAFALLADEAALGEYVWGAAIGRRYFCKPCGVPCSARAHLEQPGGDSVPANLHCLDDVDPADVKVVHWDGRHDNWAAGPRDTPYPIASGPT